MADEQESGSVGQDAFSEEILAWMAAGDALATPAPEGAEDDAEQDDAVLAARGAPLAARVAALAAGLAPLVARFAHLATPGGRLAARVAALAAPVAPLAARVSALAARVIRLAVAALASWWEALPVPRRRTAIATAIGGLLLLGGLAVSQASSPRRTVAVAVIEATPHTPVAAPARTALPVAVATTERPAARIGLPRSSHPAQPARAKGTSRSPHKHSVVTVPSRR